MSQEAVLAKPTYDWLGQLANAARVKYPVASSGVFDYGIVSKIIRF